MVNKKTSIIIEFEHEYYVSQLHHVIYCSYIAGRELNLAVLVLVGRHRALQPGPNAAKANYLQWVQLPTFMVIRGVNNLYKNYSLIILG